MKLSELKRIIDLTVESLMPYDDPEVMVNITTSGSVGGTPCVKVKNAFKGFDWDSGKFIIMSDEPVMKVNQKTVEELRKEAEKIGWDIYENRSLKAEVKKLKDKIKNLIPKVDDET